MADISQMSDDQLNAAIAAAQGGNGTSTPAPQATAPTDLKKLSDAQLHAAIVAATPGNPDDVPNTALYNDRMSHQGYDPANRVTIPAQGTIPAHTIVHFNDDTLGFYGPDGSRVGQVHKAAPAPPPGQENMPQMGSPETISPFGTTAIPNSTPTLTPDQQFVQAHPLDPRSIAYNLGESALTIGKNLAPAVGNVLHAGFTLNDEKARGLLARAGLQAGKATKAVGDVTGISQLGQINDSEAGTEGADPLNTIIAQAKKDPKGAAATAVTMLLLHHIRGLAPELSEGEQNAIAAGSHDAPPNLAALSDADLNTAIAKAQAIPPATNVPPIRETAGNAAVRASIVNGSAEPVNISPAAKVAPVEAQASPVTPPAPVARVSTSAPVSVAPTPIPVNPSPTPTMEPFENGTVIRPVVNAPAIKAAQPVMTIPEAFHATGNAEAPMTINQVAKTTGRTFADTRDSMVAAQAAGDLARQTDGTFKLTPQGKGAPVNPAVSDIHPQDFNAYKPPTEPMPVPTRAAPPSSGINPADALPHISPPGTIAANAVARLSLSEHLDTIGNAAADRVTARANGRLTSGVDPKDIQDAGIWLGTKIVKGLVDGTNFAKAVVQQFGERLTPHLQAIWQQAKNVAKWYTGNEDGHTDFGKLFAKDAGTEEKPASSAQDTMGLFQRMRFGLQGGPFRSTGAFSEPAAQSFVQRGSARETTDAMHEYALRGITGKGTKGELNPDQMDLFGRYFSHERALDYDAAGQKHTIPYLSVEQQNAVRADPAIQKAIQAYNEHPIVKWIAQTRLDTSPGMKMRQMANGNGANFLSMIAKKDASGTAVDVPQGPLQSSGTPVRVGASRFAQEANGQAKEWNHDFSDRLQASVSDAVNQESKHNALRELLNARDTEGNPLAHVNHGITQGVGGRPRIALGADNLDTKIPLPATMKYDGKIYKTAELNARVYIERPDGTKALVRLAVPRVVANDFDRAQDPGFNMGNATGAGAHENYEKFSSAVTGISLASPSEASSHIISNIAQAAAIPNVRARMTTRVIQGLAPFVTTAGKVLKLDGADPAFHNDLIYLSKIGAGSTRAFQHAVDSIQSNIPILKQVGQASAYQHKLLFGIPGGRGVGDLFRNGGFDMKLRVMLLREFRIMRPNASDAETRSFINQFGQYASVKDPSVNLARYLHPFAATSLPKIGTALRQMVGDAGYQNMTPRERVAVAANMAANVTLSTIYTHYALNYALSGHAPTDNAPGHKFDIDLGNGSYIPFRLTNPVQSRAMNTFGLRDDAEDAMDSNLTAGGAANNLGRGLYNEIAQQISNIGLQAASTAAIGRYPGYITRRGEMLKTAPVPNDPLSRGLAAVAGTNNISQSIMQYLANRSGQ